MYKFKLQGLHCALFHYKWNSKLAASTYSLISELKTARSTAICLMFSQQQQWRNITHRSVSFVTRKIKHFIITKANDSSTRKLSLSFCTPGDYKRRPINSLWCLWADVTVQTRQYTLHQVHKGITNTVRFQLDTTLQHS